VALTAPLAALRAALTADRCNGRLLAETRHSHEDLDRALAHAIAYAFAADAQGASTPAGIVSWAAEGLARSNERELAKLAAMDVCGLAQPLVRPNRHWGDLPSNR
jgi:acyl-CoA reductase-like NAD-dependent aldehyde dehydrogenase